MAPGVTSIHSEGHDCLALAIDDLNATSDMRRQYGDLEIEMPDGTTISAREMLDDLDKDIEMERGLDACFLDPMGAFR